MPQNAFFSTNSRSSSQPKNDAKTLFAHPPSPLPGNVYNCNSAGIWLLRYSRFNFHCYTQREATPTQKSARKWRSDLSRLLARKITKGTHSCKPASLNRPICWASFEIKGLCPVLNRNWVCLVPVHTCVAECAWNVGYICQCGASFLEDVPLVDFTYLVITRIPVSYRRRLRSLLLCLCDVFRTLN